ncbi:MAG: hypothetical protein JWO87_2353 [Phycisphaerales bacterium]|nr:hypothetical protein [Phycisphaerales bacterium]MDB5300690.1 hypothetical protein [Phycisphaerales bacterium]
MTQQAAPQEPSAAPRKLTARVRRRAWGEPRVRFWWLIGVVMLGIGTWFAVVAFRDRAKVQWLIDRGIPVEALVNVANTETVRNRAEPPDSIVELRFDWHGQSFTPHPRMLPGRKEPIITKSKLLIHVNPNDPNDWTWLSAPEPLLTLMTGALVAIPIGVCSLLAALLVRGRMLRVWRTGEAVETLVMDSRNTALAPLSRAARVTPADEDDKRLYKVFVPAGIPLDRGESVWIIRAKRNSTSAVSAAWFE